MLKTKTSIGESNVSVWENLLQQTLWVAAPFFLWTIVRTFALQLGLEKKTVTKQGLDSKLETIKYHVADWDSIPNGLDWNTPGCTMTVGVCVVFCPLGS